MNINDSSFLYPNVTVLPGQAGGVKPGELGQGQPKVGPSEFDHVFEKTLDGTQQDLGQLKAPLKFSAHAMQRMSDRGISFDQDTMLRINDAVDKAKAKGVEETLILTGDAALIVSVKNKTVITALDKGSMNGNVFTNIDGAVIV